MNSKILTLTGIALIAASCSVGVGGGKFTPEGIYECKPKEGFQGPIYKFDSTDERTLVWLGSDTGFEFYDLNSKQMARLYVSSNLEYDCKCIREKSKNE